MSFSTQKTKYLAISLNPVVNSLCDFNPKWSSRIYCGYGNVLFLCYPVW